LEGNGQGLAIIAKDMTGELERSGSKIKKAQLEEQWEEIRGNNYEVTSLKTGQKEFDKLAKVYGFEKDEKGNMVRTSPTQHGNEKTQIIKEQMYIDKLADKAEPEYKRRWTSHSESSKTHSYKQLIGFLSIQCISRQDSEMGGAVSDLCPLYSRKRT
jgi:hypothetical protein